MSKSPAARAIAANNRAHAARRLETKIGAWCQLWLLFSTLALASLLTPFQLDWAVVAAMCGGQNALLLLLLIVNHVKWRAEFSRQRWEAEHNAQQ